MSASSSSSSSDAGSHASSATSVSSTSTGPSPQSRIGHLVAGCLELTSVLGVGAYGVVYSAIDTFTGTPYAVKCLAKAGLDARQQKFQQREIALHMKASGHRNVLQLVRVLDAPDCTYVILEYCPEGDLFANITERGNYVGNDALAKRIFLQLLDAVEYCHHLGIYHRDLKPENVLVTEGGMTVKLADFGLATTESMTADFGCGSTFYMSPECQHNSQHRYYASAPNDIWSLGVILVNLTCGRNPWKRASQSDSTYRAFLKDRHFLRSILPISADLNHILTRIFEQNPLKRISIPELRARILACDRFTTGQQEEEEELVEEEMELEEDVRSESYFHVDSSAPVPSQPPKSGFWPFSGFPYIHSRFIQPGVQVF